MGTSSVKRTCSINDKCNLPLSPKFQFNEIEIRLKIFHKNLIKMKMPCSQIIKNYEEPRICNSNEFMKSQQNLVVLVSLKSNHFKTIIGPNSGINCFGFGMSCEWVPIASSTVSSTASPRCQYQRYHSVSINFTKVPSWCHEKPHYKYNSIRCK